jgi:hypothetical protein
MRNLRKVIAIHEITGERKEFASAYEAATVLGCTRQGALHALECLQAVKGWKLYDTPEKYRERINEFEGIIKMLEG